MDRIVNEVRGFSFHSSIGNTKSEIWHNIWQIKLTKFLDAATKESLLRHGE